MKLKIVIIISIIFISIITIIAFTASIFASNPSNKQNILGNPKIYWSPGWKRLESGNTWSKEVIYQGILGGSEFNFKFMGGDRIIFQIETTNKDPLIGLEVWVDGKYFDFAYPNLSLDKTTLEIGEKAKNTIHEVRGKLYCFIIPETTCDLRIKSIEIDGSAKILSPAKNIKKTLAILGDSISGVWGNRNYTFLLSEKLNYNLINASFNGSTIAEEGGTFSGSLRVKKEIIPYKPDSLIIFLGTNDLGHKLKFENFSRDYEKTVNLLIKKIPETSIILVGLLPRTDYSFQQIYPYSETIKKIASKYNLSYIDPYTWLAESDLGDGLHPSRDAQIKISDKLFTYIKENNLPKHRNFFRLFMSNVENILTNIFDK